MSPEDKELLRKHGRAVFLRAAETLRACCVCSGNYETSVSCCDAIRYSARKEIYPNASFKHRVYEICVQFFAENFRPKGMTWGYWWSNCRGNFLNGRIARLLHAAELVGEL